MRKRGTVRCWKTHWPSSTFRRYLDASFSHQALTRILRIPEKSLPAGQRVCKLENPPTAPDWPSEARRALLGQGAVVRAECFLDGSGEMRGGRALCGAAHRESRGFQSLRSRWPDGSKLRWQHLVVTGVGSALNSFLRTLPSSLTLSMRQLAQLSLQNCTNPFRLTTLILTTHQLSYLDIT